MSYPKQHPSKTMNMSDTRSQIKTQKRDQVKQMLVNKFRNKYNAKSSKIDDYELIIREEVESMMANTNLLEADLVNADKQIRARLGLDNEAKRSSVGSSIDNLKYQLPEQREGEHPLQSSVSQRSLY